MNLAAMDLQENSAHTGLVSLVLHPGTGRCPVLGCAAHSGLGWDVHKVRLSPAGAESLNDGCQPIVPREA